TDVDPHSYLGMVLVPQAVPVLPYPTPFRSTCATAAVVYSAITNGSFEAGLAGWSYNAGVYSIGHFSTQPIGVDGSLCADLGGAGVSGSTSGQPFPDILQTRYQLTFASQPNG